MIADDHKLFRHGIISLLENTPGISIVSEVEDGQELVEKYFKIRPDLLLLDISMPVKTGISAFKELKRRDPSVKVLFLTVHSEDEFVYQAFKFGAMGLISKNILKGELLFAIKSATKGHRYFGTGWPNDKLKELNVRYNRYEINKVDKYSIISPKEREILKLISKGFTSSDIAKELRISKRTVDTHRSKIMQKLNIHSAAELQNYATKFAIDFNFFVDKI